MSTCSSHRHSFEVTGQFHAPVALPQGKSLRCQLDRRVAEVERRKILPLQRLQLLLLGRLALSQSLYQLCCPVSTVEKRLRMGWGWVYLACWPLFWSMVRSLDDRWWWMWNSRWNENWEGKPKYSEKTYPSATLSTTNPTWPYLG
jgi:hypothetical protein